MAKKRRPLETFRVEGAAAQSVAGLQRGTLVYDQLSGSVYRVWDSRAVPVVDGGAHVLVEARYVGTPFAVKKEHLVGVKLHPAGR